MVSLLNLSTHKCPDFCDICEEERPRWYCAVDEAYLCDKCDSSVHEANSLALRHERVTLGYNEQAQKDAPGPSPGRDELFLSKIKHEASTPSASSCNWSSDSFQKARNGRYNDAFQGGNSSQNSFIKIGGITFTRATKVQLDSDSRYGDEHEQLESFVGLSKWRSESESCPLVHEVPVLVPVAQDMPPTALQDLSRQSYCSSLTAPLEDASVCDFMGFLVPDCYDVDDSPLSSNGYISTKEESDASKAEETVSFDEPNEEKECNASKTNDSKDEFLLTGHGVQSSVYYDYQNYSGPIAGNFAPNYAELNAFKHSGEPEVFVPLTLVCEKLKVEICSDQIGRHLEATANGPSINDIRSETQNPRSFNLRLNYEDVLNAWPDRGCFWRDGQSPQTVPTDSRSQSADEAALDVGIVPELSYESTATPPENKEETISCTTLDGGREARVLRYREKRRTRLFSKKIRYEVRKLNAERRPRIKGRFVKKST